MPNLLLMHTKTWRRRSLLSELPEDERDTCLLSVLPPESAQAREAPPGAVPDEVLRARFEADGGPAPDIWGDWAECVRGSSHSSAARL